MTYVLWCPKHKMVVEVSFSSELYSLGTGKEHRVSKNCLADFEVRRVKP